MLHFSRNPVWFVSNPGWGLVPVFQPCFRQNCSHRFCRPCLEAFIQGQMDEGLLPSEIQCPLEACEKCLSIRDTQARVTHLPSHHIPRAQRSHSCVPTVCCFPFVCHSQDFTRRGTVNVHGSIGASKRLHKELKMIQRAGPEKLGFTVALVGDSLYEWEVKVVGFDESVCWMVFLRQSAV